MGDAGGTIPGWGMTELPGDPAPWPPIIVRPYKGTAQSGQAQFAYEASQLARYGYLPVSQQYQAGSWDAGRSSSPCCCRC
jgi:hypothetical protein